MNIKLLTALAIALPLFTVACAKKEAPAEQAAPAETAPADQAVTPEQQAAIDSVDQPNAEAIAVDGETATPDASVEATETATVAPADATTANSTTADSTTADAAAMPEAKTDAAQ